MSFDDDHLEPEWDGQYLTPPSKQRTGTQFGWLWALLGSDLPQTVKLTGVVMALHGDEKGRNIRPSVETVAGIVGKSPRRVTADRATLREAGWLILADGTHSTSHGVSDRYELARPPGYQKYRKPITPAKQRGKFESYEGYSSTLKQQLDAKAQERKDEEGSWIHRWLNTVVMSAAFTPAERLLAAALALAGSQIGTNIHLGVPNMAAVTRLSERTAKRALAGLRESGAAQLAMNTRTHGKGLRNSYVLDMPKRKWLTARLREHDERKVDQSLIGESAVRARWRSAKEAHPEPEANCVQTWGQMRTEPGVTSVALPTTALPTSVEHAPSLDVALTDVRARQNGHEFDERNSDGSTAVGAEKLAVADVVDLAAYRRARPA